MQLSRQSAMSLILLFDCKDFINIRSNIMIVIIKEPKATVPKWYLNTTWTLVEIGLSKYSLFLKVKIFNYLLKKNITKILFDIPCEKPL